MGKKKKKKGPKKKASLLAATERGKKQLSLSQKGGNGPSSFGFLLRAGKDVVEPVEREGEGEMARKKKVANKSRRRGSAVHFIEKKTRRLGKTTTRSHVFKDALSIEKRGGVHLPPVQKEWKKKREKGGKLARGKIYDSSRICRERITKLQA